MKLHVISGDILECEVDSLIFFCYEDQPLNEVLKKVDAAAKGELSASIASGDFTGKSDEIMTLYRPDGISVKQVIVVGMGRYDLSSAVTLRRSTAYGVRRAQEGKARTIAITVVEAAQVDDLASSTQSTIEGALLASYRFDRYKSHPKEVAIQAVTVVATPEQDLTAIQRGVRAGHAVAEAIYLARDIVNEPPSKITPSALTHIAADIATQSARCTLSVLDKDQLEEGGYNAILSVAAGSEQPPYLIHLHYKPDNPAMRIAFVGKGVTFDSGGLGIKPWDAMLTMKSDMAGGAAALGIMQAIISLEKAGYRINKEVDVIIPATENMISGKAMKPDDIIETRSGKTVEVLHTDAEGRLILADALAYATELTPHAIIDFATLTGAAIRAVGKSYSAYMGNNEELITCVRQSSRASGELAWQLPLAKEYRTEIESSVADLQNIGGKSSPDAIIGGLFLNEFVGDTPWVHIDIAGPSFADDNKNPLLGKGGTGYGVLLGLEILRQITA